MDSLCVSDPDWKKKWRYTVMQILGNSATSSYILYNFPVGSTVEDKEWCMHMTDRSETLRKKESLLDANEWIKRDSISIEERKARLALKDRLALEGCLALQGWIDDPFDVVL